MTGLLTGIAIASGVSLINFLATISYNFITGSKKTFFWGDKNQDLRNIKSQIDTEELRRRIRIVVIDDEDSFPVSLFQSEGYAIDKWDKVIDYGKIESGFYDIIVLDIKGVAQHIVARPKNKTV